VERWSDSAHGLCVTLIASCNLALCVLLLHSTHPLPSPFACVAGQGRNAKARDEITTRTLIASRAQLGSVHRPFVRNRDAEGTSNHSEACLLVALPLPANHALLRTWRISRRAASTACSSLAWALCALMTARSARRGAQRAAMSTREVVRHPQLDGRRQVPRSHPRMLSGVDRRTQGNFRS